MTDDRRTRPGSMPRRMAWNGMQPVTETEASPPRPAYPIESVDNALRLLLLLRDRGSIRVSEASDIIGVARSTAHRLLSMLQYHGFVDQDEASKAYIPGTALLQVGLAAVRGLDVRQQARPYLEQLHQEWDETVHLVVPQDSKVLFVDAIESTRPIRVSLRTGSVMHAHCTSVGKAILAQLPPQRVRKLYPRERLPDLTDHSITSRSALEEELVQVRERGYATNIGETETEVGSAGAAICDSSGRPVGAISIAAPLSRLDDRRIELFGVSARDAARAVGELLG